MLLLILFIVLLLAVFPFGLIAGAGVTIRPAVWAHCCNYRSSAPWRVPFVSNAHAQQLGWIRRSCA